MNETGIGPTLMEAYKLTGKVGIEQIIPNVSNAI